MQTSADGKLSCPRRRVFSTPRLLGSSTGALEYWIARSNRASEVVASASSRTQRVGILDHVGAATGGGAGREQHEALGPKYLARKIAAHRQIIRDILAGSIVQPRQRDVRGEFAPLG